MAPYPELHSITGDPASVRWDGLIGPALFDPQVNGFGGVDYQDPDLTRDALEHSMLQIHKAGCSHILLTLLTQSTDFLEHRLSQIHTWLGESRILRDTILGFHLEGPFLSPEAGYPGAHDSTFFSEPNKELVDRLINASGRKLSMLTLAPELPGAINLIRHLRSEGVWVALGHTNASMEVCQAAVEAGARIATHLGNGCPEQLHRHDNIIHRLLSLHDLWVSVIPDGLHIPNPALSNLVRTIGPSRLLFTTDAISAAGALPGKYTLGKLRMEVGKDGIVRHPDGKSFAGSSLRMIDGLLNAVKIAGLGYRPAWHAWTRLRTKMFPDVAVPELSIPVVSTLDFEPPLSEKVDQV